MFIDVGGDLLNDGLYADGQEMLPDIAKTLIEALANASSNRDFIPWLLDYIESTHNNSP